MIRSLEAEILDGDGISDEVLDRAHGQLSRLHWFLGNHSAIIRALRRDALPVRRVLDIGCGRGAMLLEVQRRLGAAVVGVDLRPPPSGRVPFPILRADAVVDPLPEADVAISLCMGHHLSEEQLAGMIRNVGKSCRRFILLDLVRSPLPLALFRTFVTPFLAEVNAADGITSIRRAYTPRELKTVAQETLRESSARFEHRVTLLRSRQVLDIQYA